MTKTLIASAALLLSAALAHACPTHQAMSCADGMVWDAEAKDCVRQISS